MWTSQSSACVPCSAISSASYSYQAIFSLLFSCLVACLAVRCNEATAATGGRANGATRAGARSAPTAGHHVLGSISHQPRACRRGNLPSRSSAEHSASPVNSFRVATRGRGQEPRNQRPQRPARGDVARPSCRTQTRASARNAVARPAAQLPPLAFYKRNCPASTESEFAPCGWQQLASEFTSCYRSNRGGGRARGGAASTGQLLASRGRPGCPQLRALGVVEAGRWLAPRGAGGRRGAWERKRVPLHDGSGATHRDQTPTARANDGPTPASREAGGGGFGLHRASHCSAASRRDAG